MTHLDPNASEQFADWFQHCMNKITNLSYISSILKNFQQIFTSNSTMPKTVQQHEYAQNYSPNHQSSKLINISNVHSTVEQNCLVVHKNTLKYIN